MHAHVHEHEHEEGHGTPMAQVLPLPDFPEHTDASPGATGPVDQETETDKADGAATDAAKRPYAVRLLDIGTPYGRAAAEELVAHTAHIVRCARMAGPGRVPVALLSGADTDAIRAWFELPPAKPRRDPKLSFEQYLSGGVLGFIPVPRMDLRLVVLRFYRGPDNAELSVGFDMGDQGDVRALASFCITGTLGLALSKPGDKYVSGGEMRETLLVKPSEQCMNAIRELSGAAAALTIMGRHASEDGEADIVMQPDEPDATNYRKSPNVEAVYQAKVGPEEFMEGIGDLVDSLLHAVHADRLAGPRTGR